MRLNELLFNDYAIIYKNHETNINGGIIIKARNFSQAYRFAIKTFIKGTVKREIISIEKLYT